MSEQAATNPDSFFELRGDTNGIFLMRVVPGGIRTISASIARHSRKYLPDRTQSMFCCGDLYSGPQ